VVEALGMPPLPSLHLGANVGRVEVARGAGVVKGRSKAEVAAWLCANDLDLLQVLLYYNKVSCPLQEQLLYYNNLSTPTTCLLPCLLLYHNSLL
jgi:hypothetical protein